MSSIEYQPPTALSGAYDPTGPDNTVSWTASVDGVPELFLSSADYIVDSSADHVQVTGIGAGGGGTSSTNQADSGNSGSFGGYGGGGGAYAQATFQIADLTPGPVAVVIGAAGPGGAATTSDVIGATFNYGTPGTPGGDTSFGSVLTAGGGAGGEQGGASPAVAPGGIATIVGGTSIITETGGTGAFFAYTGVGSDPMIAAGNTTLAGAGGGSSGLGAGNDGVHSDPLPGGDAGSVAGGAGGLNSFYPPIFTGGNAENGSSQTGIRGGSGGGGGGVGSNFDTSVQQDMTGGLGGNGGFPGGGGGGSGMVVALYEGGGPSGHCFAFGVVGGDGGAGELETITYWLHTHDPQYIVYRNGTPIGVTAQGVTTFVDESPLAGANTYTVYASYDGVSLNSAASDPFTITVSLGKVYLSGKFSPANAFAPIMLINLKGVKPRFYVPVINPNMRSRR